jgi:hypothetical protein
MILREYVKAKQIIERPNKSAIVVTYNSPKSDIEAERWGDYKIAILAQIQRLNKRKEK